MATGLTLSTTSNLSSGQKILWTTAKAAFEPAAPDPDIVSNERIPQGHLTWRNGIFARLAQANALSEGVDLGQTEQLVVNYTSITPTEHGIITTLSKRLVRVQGDTAVIGTAGKLMGIALRARMANDVIALYDTLTKSIVGTGSPLDVTYFRGAVSYLMTDNNTAYGPAQPPFVAALHSEQISDIIVDITDPGAVISSRFGWSAEMMQRWWRTRDRLYGVEVFLSGYIARSGNDAKGFLGDGDAFHLVMATGADAENEKDISLRATEYGLFQEWGEALQIDPHAVEVFSDAAATV